MSEIDKLIADFVKVHKADYFEMQPYIQYLRAAYALGFQDGRRKENKEKPVMRSDGVRYISMKEAAEKNFVNPRCISKAIIKNHKSAGYYWQKI
jgi:hypothetical protein